MPAMRKSKLPDAGSHSGSPISVLVADVSGERRFVYWAFVVSFVCHLAVFGALLFTQKYKPRDPDRTSVINVSLVSTPVKAVSAAPAAKQTADAPKVKTPRKRETPKRTVAVEAKPAAKEPVVSTSGKPKVSLKKKTFKPSKVKKSALEDIEKKVEKTSSERITSALDRIKAKVEEQEVEKRSTAEEAPTQESEDAAGGEGGQDAGRVGELIDLYRVEIAMQIEKHWAFSEGLAGGARDLEALLVFKVMPNGEIRDLFWDKRSGNAHLDESAYRAIMKANPVDPHPPGIIRPYVEMGLRFTPEGLR